MKLFENTVVELMDEVPAFQALFGAVLGLGLSFFFNWESRPEQFIVSVLVGACVTTYICAKIGFCVFVGALMGAAGAMYFHGASSITEIIAGCFIGAGSIRLFQHIKNSD